MLDELRERMATYLAEHQVGVLSIAEAEDTWAMPVRYHLVPDADDGHTLAVDCLLPRWADVAYHLEQDPRVMLVVHDAEPPSESAPGQPARWLQIRGTAQPLAEPDWAQWFPTEQKIRNSRYAARTTPYTANLLPHLYLVVRLTPQRLDLLDESRGWGVRETLDLE